MVNFVECGFQIRIYSINLFSIFNVRDTIRDEVKQVSCHRTTRIETMLIGRNATFCVKQQGLLRIDSNNFEQAFSDKMPR